MFYDVKTIPALRRLQEGWLSVLAGLQGLTANNFALWPETGIYDGVWGVFGLYEFGNKNEKHSALCPATTAVVEAIPGMVTAGFSMLSGRHARQAA
jgi:hypothetical protein